MRILSQRTIYFCLFLLLLFTSVTYASEQLLEAIYENEFQTVKRLLEAGADPNAGVEEGMPALLVAIIFESDVDLLKLLIDSGADLNWADEDGFSILMFAAITGSSPSVLKTLIDRGASVNYVGDSGITLLMAALMAEAEKETIELLLESGTNVNTRDNDGLSPLMYACILAEEEEIVHLLLDAGADAFLTFDADQTILDLIEINPNLRNSLVHQRIKNYFSEDPSLASSLVFSFPEVVVPSATGFPTGNYDQITNEVVESFYMAAHEVSYGLWKEVYDWATSPERGDNRYYFWREGHMGSSDIIQATPDYPVTRIVWFDAVNWCNALTEYYNYRNGTDLECVYYNKNILCRDSRQSSIYETIHDVEAMPDHRGFRLPTSIEWDLAARYQDGVNWTPNNAVSGGIDIDDPRVEDYAWFYFNAEKHAHPVGTKLPNALGIYDMSGNVAEYCFTLDFLDHVDERVLRGGDYYANHINLWLGNTPGVWPGSAYSTNGFRVVRALGY